MRLVAGLIVRNETHRYLTPCLESLLAFCDEVRVLDDGSTDGSADLAESLGAVVKRSPRSVFYEHEGRARNELLDWALDARPTHMLVLDADEFVSDGSLIRTICETDARAGRWILAMEEIWKADARHLYAREDGLWGGGSASFWLVPPANKRNVGAWHVPNKALACGREPLAARRARTVRVRASVLHFGWANEAERVARSARYDEHDGGQYHLKAHLDSIMWPDRKIRVRRRHWPEGLDKATILDRVHPPVAA